MSRSSSCRQLALAALVTWAVHAGCGSDSSSKESPDAAGVPDASASPTVADGGGADATLLIDTVSPAFNTKAADAGASEVDRLAGLMDGAAKKDDGGPGPGNGEARVDGGNVTVALDGGSAALTPQSPATIVVLPDTQYYTASYPSVFNQQISWIVAQKSALNIDVALHVGDLVDADIAAQWTVAEPAMRVLDKVGIPYAVVPGNHDYTGADRKTLMSNYFSPASMPWVTGTMVPGQIENNYMLVDIGPRTWLVVGIEFGARDSVVKWADSIMKAYAQYPAILVTHAYLYADNTRYDINVGGTDSNASTYQYWNPQYYGYTAAEGINDGEAMWQKIVRPNSNVKLVFSGHVTGGARLTSTRPDGTTVHQMLSDYQWLEGENFGYGYLRVVRLDYDKKTIDVQTYSPYLGQYKTDNDNQFTLDLNL